MIADMSILSQFAVSLSGYLRSAANDPAKLDELNRFFNSVEWEDLIEPDSSLSRIFWSIQNILYLHESYGDRVDADHRQASLIGLADTLDKVDLVEIHESVVHKAVVQRYDLRSPLQGFTQSGMVPIVLPKSDAADADPWVEFGKQGRVNVTSFGFFGSDHIETESRDESPQIHHLDVMHA